MRKLFALILTALLVVTAFAGCTAEKTELKLGVGTEVVYSAEQTGSVSCDTTVAAVITDKNGKIVDCVIDSSTAKVDISDGFLQDGAKKLSFKSKNDLGDEYNMKLYGKAIGEWYEQAAAFADFCKGKTADEVGQLAINEQGKPTDADLAAGCTIAVGDFIKAVIKACRDPLARSFGESEVQLALQLDSKVDSAADSEDNNGMVGYLIGVSAVAVDARGRLAAAVVDAAQPEFAYDDNGAVTNAKFGGTKRELGDNYGMVAYAGAVAEWYQQSAAMCEWLEGLTAEEIKASVGTDGRAADADLLASCTIAISGDTNQIINAMNKAK